LSAGTHLLKSATMSERDEKAMGQSVAMQVTSRYRITSEQKLNQYVVLVGLTLASSSERPDGNWFFAVVDNDQPNAFSGPDGYIFITRGALKQMHDESELAGVLAHEMTHVLSHHGLNAAKQSERTSALTDVAGTQMKGAQQEFTGLVNGAADVVLNKGYDRPQEDQADAGAIQLLVAAGYDPNGYLNFLTRVAGEQHGGATIAAFSTHPDAAGRVAKVRSQIASAPKGGVTLKERFERMTK
jgi:predicted Zn-dependent protease